MYDSVQSAVAASLGQAGANVSDSITEKGDKIVVTTTISLDKSTLEPNATQSVASLLAKALAGGAERKDAATSPVMRAIAENRIQVVPIGPKLFLGLVNGRTHARPLCIDGTLFIFVPRSNSLTSMAELVAELLQRLPPDLPWSVALSQDHLPGQSSMGTGTGVARWNAEQIAEALNQIAS